MEPITTIGRILDTEQPRDAIHMAIMPVIAGERLEAGEHVGILPDGTVGNCDAPLGIIDPFLTVNVKKGQRCWMFLYPNTITSLRHEWTHPALDESAREEQSAKESLLNFASREGISFDSLMAGLDYGYESGGEVCFPHDINYAIKEEEAPDVWRAYCLYTGKKMPQFDVIENTTFRCAC